ncbi:hypothetical protein ACLBXM_02265 [Xanthobacteraceae bacterium A53D]
MAIGLLVPSAMAGEATEAPAGIAVEAPSEAKPAEASPPEAGPPEAKRDPWVGEWTSQCGPGVRCNVSIEAHLNAYLIVWRVMDRPAEARGSCRFSAIAKPSQAILAGAGPEGQTITVSGGASSIRIGGITPYWCDGTRRPVAGLYMVERP